MKIKHFILPTAENDHAPHLLQKTAFFLLCGLVLLSFAVTNLQSLLWQSSDWLVSTVLPAVVVEKTNDARAKRDEQPLKRNALLDKAARLKAEDMAKNHYFAHQSPAGVSPWYWFDEVGYVYAHAGENLAVHFNDSKAVVDAWLKSPTHRANIENANYLEIGVGTAEGTYEGFKTVFVVQLFGTPAAPIQPISAVPAIPKPVVVAASSDLVVEEGIVDSVLDSVSSAQIQPAEIVIASESSTKIEAEQARPDMLSEGGVTERLPEPIPSEQSSELFVATTSPYVPASIDDIAPTTQVYSVPGALATTPNVVLRYIYLSLGTLISILLLLSVVLAARHHRPWQIAYGIGLLILMTGLFYLQSHLTSTVALADSSLIATPL